MFSGKTECLISLANRELIARRKVQYFIPTKDTRNGVGVVRSNGGINLVSLGVLPEVVDSAKEITDNLRAYTDLICIDEAQFSTTRY